MAVVERNWKILISLIIILVVGIVVSAVTEVISQTETQEFFQPVEIKSVDGVLDFDLTVEISKNTVTDPVSGVVREIHTPTYNGGIIGPTLRIKPGDTILMDVINKLPENPPNQRMGAFPHDPYTTNIHTHGLTVDPNGISDNVVRKMLPGTTSPVEIFVYENHQTGTFWYHPHKHGSVSFQFFGGMSGFLIIEGGEGTLDTVPEVAAAKDILMGFQIIRTDQTGNLPFINPTGLRFSSRPSDSAGMYSTYQNSFFYLLTNGLTNPVLHMRPGEVQRWRLLNATSGVTLITALQGHELNIVSNDGITIPEMVTLDVEQPYVLGSGNRVDVLVKAKMEPGTYLLQALNPLDPNGPGYSIITQSGIDPAPRQARIGFDFPTVMGENDIQGTKYPYTLATIVVSGEPMDMDLPEGPLPVLDGIPTIEEQLEAESAFKRNVAFELCGNVFGMMPATSRLPSCGWYFSIYDADYWGGIPFQTLAMMRDADDEGIPNPVPDPVMPRIDYLKEGLFNVNEPLYDNMTAGNFEEWTIINRTFSDHPFHLHINPVLITHINGISLPQPEYRDTFMVPAALMGPPVNNMPNLNINEATFGSITFRTRYVPFIFGTTVMHCHILTHEDIGMMQRLDINPPIE